MFEAAPVGDVKPICATAVIGPRDPGPKHVAMLAGCEYYAESRMADLENGWDLEIAAKLFLHLCCVDWNSRYSA